MGKVKSFFNSKIVKKDVGDLILPQRERVLSTITPIIGSLIASKIPQ